MNFQGFFDMSQMLLVFPSFPSWYFTSKWLLYTSSNYIGSLRIVQALTSLIFGWYWELSNLWKLQAHALNSSSSMRGALKLQEKICMASVRRDWLWKKWILWLWRIKVRCREGKITQIWSLESNVPFWNCRGRSCELGWVCVTKVTTVHFVCWVTCRNLIHEHYCPSSMPKRWSRSQKI